MIRARALIVIGAFLAMPLLAQKASPPTESTPTKDKRAKKQEKSAAANAPGMSTQSNEPTTTEIYADEAFFDSNKNKGIFTGHVKVIDPRFNLQSEKLTIFVSKGQNQGLEKAIAEGNVALVRDRPDPNGGPPIARSRSCGDGDLHCGDRRRGIERRSTSAGRVEHARGGESGHGDDHQSERPVDHARSEPDRNPTATEGNAHLRRGYGGQASRNQTKRIAVADSMMTAPAVKSQPGSTAPATKKIDYVLVTDQLVKIYGGRAVVNGVHLTVKAGEIVGLLGPNGAGKTTSFYMIVGLVRPNSGRVIFSGTDVTKYPMYKRARLGMGYLPQEESIFRKMTVEQNIMAILETLPLSKAERRNRCDQLLHQFGIERVAKNTALTLSGGEKRRLTIARSLVTHPKLLMLDEPFSGVDPIAVYDVQQIIVNLRKSGLAILITDHNVRETLSIVDRAYLIFEGRVESEGTKDFLINDPVSRQLYLGERFRM